MTFSLRQLFYSIGAAAFALVPLSSRAETEITYDVTWESPEQFLGARAREGAPKGPSWNRFGSPYVRENIGSLVGRCLELKTDQVTAPDELNYEQVVFEVLRGAVSYEVEFEFCIVNLPEGSALRIFLDGNGGAGTSLQFDPNGTYYYAGEKNFSFNTTIHCRFVFDRPTRTIEVYIDGALVGSSTRNDYPFSDLSSLRVSLNDPSTNALVGLGDVQITSTEPESPDIPPMPENLRVLTNATPDAINLVWDEIPGATSYRIYRSLGSFGRELYQEGVTENQFLDVDVEADRRYYYSISAVGTKGEGDRSDTRSGIVDDNVTGPPESPEGLETTPIVGDPDSFVAVAWQPTNRTVEYEVFRATTPEFFDEVQIAVTTETVFLDGPIGDFETRYYRVASVNGYGRSPRSQWVYGRIPRESTRIDGSGGPIEPADPIDSDLTDESYGFYGGLLYDSDQPETIVGKLSYFKIRTATRRNPPTFSGQMVLGRKIYRIRGEIGPTGLAIVQHRDFTGAFQIQITEDNRYVLSGQVVFPETSLRVGIRGYRSLSRAEADPETKRQTIFLPASADPSDPMPDGDGTGSLVARRGLVRVLCVLGDGTRTTFSMREMDGGRVHFFKTLYGGAARGFVAGEYVLVEDDPLTDLSGTAYWEKGELPRPGRQRYPDGFAGNLEIVGSLYDPAEVGDIPGEPETSLFLAIMEGGDLQTTEEDFFLTSYPRGFLRDSERRFKGRINPRTGLFTARVRVPYERKVRILRGALNQKQQIVTGLYVGSRECGFMSIVPEELDLE